MGSKDVSSQVVYRGEFLCISTIPNEYSSSGSRSMAEVTGLAGRSKIAYG